MLRLRPDCGGCERISPERSERIINAVLANIGNWEERIAEIEEHAIPTNKMRALALMRDMRMARLSLKRLAGLDA